MPSLFQNRYVKFIGLGVAVLFGGLVLLAILGALLGSLSHSTGLDSRSYNTLSVPQMGYSPSFSNEMAMESADAIYDDGGYYPEPIPSGYTAELETYETTTYTVSGRTKQFDEACATIADLKADPNIHFQSINTDTNYCRASFYVGEVEAAAVVDTLSGFKGIELTRDTSSVTRHRQQIQGRTSILQQQLRRVEQTLSAAEAQLARLNSRFQTTDEVVELSGEVTRSLQFIDQMTNKKINLISQLDNMYQQAADLEARMDVVAFSLNISRSNPLYPSKYEQQWERAWESLQDAYHETLMALTAFFGIFLLWVFRIAIYSLVLIVIIRGLWKFVKLVWSKW